MDSTSKIADFQHYKNKKLRAIILSKVDKKVYESTEKYYFEFLCKFMIEYIHAPETFQKCDKERLKEMLDHFKMESLTPLTVNKDD